MTRRALLTLACFLGLAITTALVAARIVQPHATLLLVAAAALATAAGAPGIVHSRARPLALLLLPLGAYVLARLQIRLPDGAGGIHAQTAFYAHQIASGATTYVHQAFPLDSASPALLLVLSLCLFGLTWLASFLALSLRRALPAVVVLLCVAGFGFTTDEAARTPLPAIAFVMLAGGLLALSRPRSRERVRPANAVAGVLTATLAALLALSILGVTTVEAGSPLGDWRSWELSGPKAATLDYDWMQNYPKLLSKASDAVVMEVRSPVQSYWRANVLTEFSGSAWLSTLDSSSLQAATHNGSWIYDTPPVQHSAQGRTVLEQFDVRNTYTDHLFVGGSPLDLRTSLPLDLAVSAAGAISVAPARGPAMSYSVTAFVPYLDPTDLVGQGRYYPADVTSTYLQLPFPSAAVFRGPNAERQWRAAAAKLPDGGQWSGLFALNQSIVGAETDPYRVALAIEDYLHAGFQYSLRPRSGGDSSPYADFLFRTHIGYCQHFAGAMALLLRFNGIPARVALGFRQGREIRDGIYEVRRTDAHAWVEAYFPGVGWAPFDPTPGTRLPSADTVAAGSAAGTIGSGDAGATTQQSQGADAPGRARVADPGGIGVAQPAAAPGHGSLLWVAVVVALLVWPVGRALLRRRGLLKASAQDRVRVSVDLLYATLGDHGLGLPPSQTLDETAGLLREQFGVDSADFATRVQAILFGGREATEQDLRDLRRFRRHVRAALRERSGWIRSLAAAYGVPSRRR